MLDKITEAKAKPYQNLGAYLKELRESKGLSQRDVSDELGYGNNQFISNWERGLSSPPLNALDRLFGLYDIDPHKIVDIMVSDQKRIIEAQIEVASRGLNKRKRA